MGAEGIKICIADKEFLIYDSERFLYKDVIAKAAQVGNALISEGIKKGDRVAICMQNNPEFIFAYMGITGIGAVCVPLNSWWVPDEVIYALQVGYRNGGCNKLRLWRADAKDIFDFYAFNIGDYLGSVEQSVHSETISKVLYPNDGTDSGRQLRLKQQFFFVSCSIQDMLGSLTKRGIPISEFADYYTLQLKDRKSVV